MNRSLQPRYRPRGPGAYRRTGPEDSSLAKRPADEPEDSRLAIEDVRAEDPVEKAFRAPSLGPLDLLGLLHELSRRRSEVDYDLRRLIERAEALGTLDIAVKGRAVLAGSQTEGTVRKEDN